MTQKHKHKKHIHKKIQGAKYNKVLSKKHHLMSFPSELRTQGQIHTLINTPLYIYE